MVMKLGFNFNGNGNVIRSIYLFHPFRIRMLLYSTSTSSSSIIQGNNNNNFAKFLVESLGFSNKQSLTTCANIVKWRRKVDLKVIDSKIVDNANSVIQFFKQLGFHHSHIRQLISRFPQYLFSSADKSLKPKVELLSQVGVVGSDLVHVVLRNPPILGYQSLGSAIHVFRIVLGTDDNVVSLLKRSLFINYKGVVDYLIPNVELLQACYGIPLDNVRKFVIRQPRIFSMRSDLFRDNLIKVEHKLGIPRHSAMFLSGFQLLYCYKENKLEDKCAVFKSFGWNQSDVTVLIRQNPMCLSSSEERIKERLGFLMNQLGYEPSYLASKAALFTCSLEKRLLPRHRVLQVLKEKGLSKKDHSFNTIVCMSESKFLERFVLPFEEVHQVYEQLMGCKVGTHAADIAEGKSN